MGESDYLDDNLMQKPFSGKENYIFFFFSFLERKNPRFMTRLQSLATVLFH
jgi:hypothetical protein